MDALQRGGPSKAGRHALLATSCRGKRRSGAPSRPGVTARLRLVAAVPGVLVRWRVGNLALRGLGRVGVGSRCLWMPACSSLLAWGQTGRIWGDPCQRQRRLSCKFIYLGFGRRRPRSLSAGCRSRGASMRGLAPVAAQPIPSLPPEAGPQGSGPSQAQVAPPTMAPARSGPLPKPYKWLWLRRGTLDASL